MGAALLTWNAMPLFRVQQGGLLPMKVNALQPVVEVQRVAQVATVSLLAQVSPMSLPGKLTCGISV